MANRNHGRQHGFTILELIVSLGLGAVITLTLFTLTAGSSRIFHEQQRVAHTQLGLRNAVERIRGDIARAGFLTTPHSQTDPNVCPPGHGADCPLPPFQGISVIQAGFVHLPAVNTLPAPDQLDIFGALDDSNVYFSQTLGAGTITLDPNTVSYQQRFATAPAPALPALMTETFDPGRKVIRIHCPGDPIVFQSVAGPAAIVAGRMQIPFGALRGVGPYQPSSIGMRCEVSTASIVRYAIRNVCGAFPSTCRTTGEPEKSDLVRIELDPATGAEIAATTRIVAEYAVDFDVRFDVDTAAVPPIGTVGNPIICRAAFANSGAWATPGAGSLAGRLRAAEFRLSVRTRDEDPGFPFVAPGGVAPVIFRYKLNAVTVGAARVRTITTQVELTTFASLNIQNPATGGAVCP